MSIFYKDELRIDPIATDADVDGAKTWSAGTVVKGRVEDRISKLILPDGTQLTSTLSIQTSQLCPPGARVFVAPQPAAGGDRVFPAGYGFAEKQWRVPVYVKRALMLGIGQVTEIYF